MTPDQEPSDDIYDKWHKDPANWFWGLFYYNKQDNRILVPKRFKWMGFTVNYANPKSVAIVVTFLGIIVILLYTA